MKVKLLVLVSAGLISCHADQFKLERMFISALSSTQGRAIPTVDEFSAVLDATIPTLDERSASRLSPLASRCLKSQEIEVQRIGAQYFSGVSVVRMDSAILLGPWIDDMIAFFANPSPENQQLRGGILISIFVLKPRMPDKVVKGLSPLLESKEFADAWKGTIAAGLIAAAPSDAEMIRMVLSRVKRFEDPKDMIPVIRSLGLESSRLGLENSRQKQPEVIAFLGECLENKDPNIRIVAAEAVGRLPFGARSSLMYRLGQISRDPTESQDIRSLAAAALK